MAKPRGHILIVDDERTIRKNLSLLLKYQDYEVDTADNGEDALMKCSERGETYDMMFVDMQMPKMGGFELLRSVKGLYPQTVVVIISAFGTVARAVEAVKLGAVDFIGKPFDPEHIKILTAEIIFRKKLNASGSVDDLLHLADLARRRSAYSEARSYLKTAIQRDLRRPEPFYELAKLEEMEGRPRSAMQFYYMSLESLPGFAPAREALERLGYIEGTKKEEVS